MGQMGKVDVLYDLRQVFCFINSIFRAWLHLLGTRLAVDLKRYSKTYIAGISGLAGLARHSLGSWSFKGVHHYCTRGILILMNFRISILACCQVVPIASLIPELFLFLLYDLSFPSKYFFGLQWEYQRENGKILFSLNCISLSISVQSEAKLLFWFFFRVKIKLIQHLFPGSQSLKT